MSPGRSDDRADMKRIRHSRPISLFGLLLLVTFCPAAASAQCAVEVLEDFEVEK